MSYTITIARNFREAGYVQMKELFLNNSAKIKWECFRLRQAWEQAKLIYGDKNKNIDCLWKRAPGNFLEPGKCPTTQHDLSADIISINITQNTLSCKMVQNKNKRVCTFRKISTALSV
jgi:hypothetical protein